MEHTCGEPNEIKLTATDSYFIATFQVHRAVVPHVGRRLPHLHGTRKEPFNSTPMGVNSILSGSSTRTPHGVASYVWCLTA